MPVTNPNKNITKQDLADFYQRLLPYLGGGSGGGSANPTGTIISFMGVYAPQGYLKCDGTVYNIADYQRLADFFKAQFGSTNYFGGDGTTTFAVPSLGGEFLRGAGTNTHADCGNGANVGIHQAPSELPNMVVYGGKIYAKTDANGNTNNSRATFDRAKSPNVKAYNFNSDGNQSETTDYEIATIRPTNTSVLYCIKD